MQPSYQVVLDSYYDLSPNTRHFQFSRTDGGIINYTPGEFIKLGFPWQGQQLQRSYSIATISQHPEQNKQLDIAIAYVDGGRGCDYFFDRKVGDCVDLYGPYGQLTLPDSLPANLWLVATGTGICPYRAMLPELSRRLGEGSLSITVLFGARNRQNQLYSDDFERLQQQYEKASVYYCYSREQDCDQDKGEYQGYVTDFLAASALSPNRDRIYLCGTPNMVEDAYQALKLRGFGVKDVRREKYVFAVK